MERILHSQNFHGLKLLKISSSKTKIKKKVDSPYSLLEKICDYLDLGANKPQPRLKLSHSREYLREKGKIKGTILALEKKKKKKQSLKIRAARRQLDEELNATPWWLWFYSLSLSSLPVRPRSLLSLLSMCDLFSF